MLWQVVLLTLAVSAYAGRFVPINNSQSGVDQSEFNSQDQSTGDAAAAGQAGADGNGSAQSINEAHHTGDGKRTSSDALSANAANGFNSNAGGAAQTSGGVQSQKAGQRFQGFNSQQVGAVIQPIRPVGGGFNGGSSGFSGGGSNGFSGFNGGSGLNRGVGGTGLGGNGGSSLTNQNQGANFKKQTQSGGNAAGAGNASAKGPNSSAQSINEAHQAADENGDQESALSANAANGWQPNTNGAAQVGGGTQRAKQGNKFSSFQQNNGHGSF